MGTWHEQRLRVRYEETDTMGVVYYSKFFVWMEVGRVGLLRDIGFGYSEWVKHEIQFPVVQAHADYRASARFDDEILVKTKIASIGNKSIRFEIMGLQQRPTQRDEPHATSTESAKSNTPTCTSYYPRTSPSKPTGQT